MSGNLLTIVTRIKQGEERTLSEFLRTHADPRYDAQTLLRCKPKFQFHKLSGCTSAVSSSSGPTAPSIPASCSRPHSMVPRRTLSARFCRLQGPACTRSINTAKGTRFRDRSCPTLPRNICSSTTSGRTPSSAAARGVRLGRLWRRTVCAVMSSRTWRRCGDGWVQARYPQLSAPAIAGGADLPSLASQVGRAGGPRARRSRIRAPMAGTGGLALLGLLSALVAVVLWLAFGLAVGDVYSKIEHWYEYGDVLNRLLEGGPSSLQWLKVPPEPDAAVRAALIALLVLWFVLRFIELICFPLSEDPSDQYFFLRYVRWVLFVLRHGVLIFLIGFAVIALAPGAQKLFEIEVDGGSRTLQTIIKKDLNLAVSRWRTVALVALRLRFRVLRRWAPSFMVEVEFQQLHARKKTFDVSSWISSELLMLVAVWLAAIALIARIPERSCNM